MFVPSCWGAATESILQIPHCRGITRWSEKRQVLSNLVDVEIDPPQPDEVTCAIVALLEEASPAVDPWWRAGVDENLDANS
jgi:hypothetical protein